MTDNNTTAKVQLRNAHGFFEVDAEVLDRAVFRLGAASTVLVRTEAAGAAGHPELPFGATALDDCTRIEALIIWIESGNHTF